MPAPKTLSAFRLRAAITSWLGDPRSLAVVVVLCAIPSPAPAYAQTTPGAIQRGVASRLKQPAEVVATPPTSASPSAAAPPSTTTEQPTYEFEAGPGMDSGGEYYESGGELYEDGSPVGGGFGEEVYSDNGYGRYGGPGIFFHPIRREQFYVRADYLLWWGKGFNAPPLVTTSEPGTSSSDAGVLGLSSTSILYPTDNLAGSSQSGGRVRLGYWFDPWDTMAVEGTYFAIGQATSSFAASDFDYPILARPFDNVTPNSLFSDAELIAFPNLFGGNIAVTGTSTLQGVEVLLRHSLCRGCDWRIDWTLGWRYNRLDDDLTISSDRVTLGSPTAPTTGATLSEWDRFSTQNTFNGVQLGLITEARRNRWWLETRTTLAFGNNRAVVNIDGQSTAIIPDPGGTSETITSSGGLLTQPTNIGEYHNDDFAVVPQIGVNLGFEITCGLWATVGYNFMYWSRVARPGDQIDTDVNLSQDGGGELLGLPRPGFTGFTTDYWAQGLNFGLAYRF